MIINGKQYAVVKVKDNSLCDHCDFYNPYLDPDDDGYICAARPSPCLNHTKIIFKEVKHATQS